MKRIALILLLGFLHLPLFSQITAGDKYYPIQPAEIFDTQLMSMTIDAARARYNADMHFKQLVNRYYTDISKEYALGNYTTCISKIEYFMKNCPIRESQLIYCVKLFELEGDAYKKMENTEKAISSYKLAMQFDSETARQELNSIYYTYFTQAQRAFDEQDYWRCLNKIDLAKSTGLSYSKASILQGDAYLGLKKYESAKSFYKAAKKMGSPVAKEKLKQLKIAKKENTNNID